MTQEIQINMTDEELFKTIPKLLRERNKQHNTIVQELLIESGIDISTCEERDCLYTFKMKTIS